MVTFSLRAVILLTLSCLPPVAAAADLVEERGLRHTDLDREIVAAAIERTNLFLADSNIRLRPSWLPPANPGAVPVYLTATDDEARATFAAVPKDCRCVFVDPAFLAAWSANASRGSGRVNVDRGYFLSYILLHEAGHLAKGTPGAAVAQGRMTQLNLEPTRAKANEEDADEFAAIRLRHHARRSPADAVSIEANFVVNELVKLSWNMQAFRTLDEFGAFAVGKPSVFFDNGYSHPNLAWRILRTNDMIQGSPATRQLLESFEDARRRGYGPAPLYHQPARQRSE